MNIITAQNVALRKKKDAWKCINKWYVNINVNYIPPKYILSTIITKNYINFFVLNCRNCCKKMHHCEAVIQFSKCIHESWVPIIQRMINKHWKIITSYNIQIEIKKKAKQTNLCRIILSILGLGVFSRNLFARSIFFFANAFLIFLSCTLIVLCISSKGSWCRKAISFTW
jgi:hypothetical protein